MAAPIIRRHDPHLIDAGLSPAFKPGDRHDVIDCGQKEPIDFIEQTLLEQSGKEKFTDVEGFSIKGEDAKNDNGTIKVLPYRDKEGVDFFTFERLYTVTFLDKDGHEKKLTFKQQIYTSVKIPMKEVPLSWRARRRGVPGIQIDMTAYENAVCIAGMAAKTYATTIQNAVKFKHNDRKGKFGEKASDKVAALQKQGYISISAKKDGESVTNPMSARDLDSAKHNQFSRIRMKIDNFEIVYDQKSKLSQKVESQSFKLKLKDRLQHPDKYQIDPDNCEGEMRYFAASLNVVQRQDRKTRKLSSGLDDQGIKSEDYLRHLESHLIVLQEHFEEDLSLFYDPEKLDLLQDKFGELGQEHVSKEFKEKLLKYMPKKKGPIKPTVAPMLTAINKMHEDENITHKEREELKKLAVAFQRAKHHAVKIEEQMQINEGDLLKINKHNKREINRIASKQEKRAELLSRKHFPKIDKNMRTYEQIEEDSEEEYEDESLSDQTLTDSDSENIL